MSSVGSSFFVDTDGPRQLIAEIPVGLLCREKAVCFRTLLDSGAPGMGDNLVVKVHYGLGSRNR